MRRTHVTRLCVRTPPRSLFGHSWSPDAVRAEPKALIERVALDELMIRTFDQLIFCESRQVVTECVQVVIFID
jgi:hypothetical protein